MFATVTITPNVTRLKHHNNQKAKCYSYSVSTEIAALREECLLQVKCVC